jgi:S1-C subfamily serine protease
LSDVRFPSPEHSPPPATPPAPKRRLAASAIIIVVLLAFGVALLSRLPSAIARANGMADSIARLSAEVSQLRQEQSMPAVVLSRNRNSICYIYALYSITKPGQRQARPLRTRVSATGFVIGDGLIATNRHVVEPWWEDEDDQAAISAGAVPRVEKLLAFFPDMADPIELTDPQVSPAVDLAVVRFQPPKDRGFRPVTLARGSAIPGDPVVVVGYPLGVTVMLAKSPRKVYQRLAFSTDTIDIARELAARKLIRPSATYGHLGDVVDERLIYDAPTAQGGSGGPVFNSAGQVIAVNTAYIDGFAGGTLGISVDLLRPLIQRAEKARKP